MEKRELELIQELMELLQGEMEYSEDDFSERLGRKKPEVEVLKVEGELGSPMKEKEMASLTASDEPEMDMEMTEEDPDEDLKQRLMKLRG